MSLGKVIYAAGDTHSFSFSTTDVSMTALMHALEGHQVRWFVTPDGIEISECICSDQVTYYANMPAKNFGKSFRCSGPVCIAFDPHAMHVLLKSHQQRDVCTWAFDPAKPGVLKISIDSQGMGELTQVSEMKLQMVDTERYDAYPIVVQYILAFEAAEIPNVIHSFVNIDKFTRRVCIETTPDHITFQHDAPIVRSCITYHMNNATTGETPPPKGDTGVVKHTYDLWHFQQILKCFSISRGAVLVFVRGNNPLVFEIKIGTLGKLRIAVLFTSDDYTDEMFLGS